MCFVVLIILHCFVYALYAKCPRVVSNVALQMFRYKQKAQPGHLTCLQGHLAMSVACIRLAVKHAWKSSLQTTVAITSFHVYSHFNFKYDMNKESIVECDCATAIDFG